MALFLLIALLAILLRVGNGLNINITILDSAIAEGAVCLDGSPPAYYIDRGFDVGLSNWIIFLEYGDNSHFYREVDGVKASPIAKDVQLQTKMDKQAKFGGILHNTPQQNPDFYNWKRVWVNYCDGSSFTGDVKQVDPENKLYFRGARIFKAVLQGLWSNGMQFAANAILSGSSAGGLATILNCDKFKSFFPDDAVNVKCVANAGFFINANTISGTPNIQKTYQRVVKLHCFFPENVVSYVQTPLFIINSAYDTWQINNTLVPSNLDPQHVWEHCKVRISDCTSSQYITIQEFGVEFMKAFVGLTPCDTRGYFITSCHTHAQIVWSDYWFTPTSPRILNKTIAEAVGDWYFDRVGFHQQIDPYPFARDC